MSQRWKIDLKDVRWFQLFLLIVIFIAPLLSKVQYSIPVNPWTQQFYDAVESLEPGSNVVIMWALASRQDGYECTPSILRHIWRQGVNIVWMDYAVNAQPLAQELFTTIWGQNWKSNPELAYGTKFVYMGLLAGAEAGCVSWIRDAKKTMTSDYYKTAISKLPLMAGISDASAIKMWINFGAGLFGGMAGGAQIIGLAKIYGYRMILTAGTPQAAGAVLGKWVSRLVEGEVLGVRGAAEYATLTGEPDPTASYINAWVIGVLLVVGGMLWLNVKQLVLPRLKDRKEP